MAFVHTAHGLGQIVATESLRGRTRHKVAGPGFEVWLDAAQVHTAEKYQHEEMYHYDTDPGDRDEGDVYSRSPVYVERDASLGDINEDNSTTLPYNPEPQYPSDMWAHDTTIQPGEQEIDAEERLSPSDSVDFDSRSNRSWPAPDPKLFAKSSGIKDWAHDLVHDPKEEEPLEVSDFVIPLGLRNKLGPRGVKKYMKEHAPELGPKYSSWMLTAGTEGDDSVARFRRDPIQEINRLGYLWTGGVEQPEMADYGRLVEADKMLREAAWADVRRKAQRLRREGRVHVLERGPGRIYSNVDGDHGTYTVLVVKTGNTQSIDKWACSCEWGKWAFQRKISYVGRLCSHGYASYLEMQSDQHKGNPGRFHHPKRTAGVTDDFQDYVDDFRDGHIDIDAADNFITLPNHSDREDPFTEDEVADIYDYARDNASTREPRNYKMPYYAAEDGERAKVLRTHPQSLTPNLNEVPPGEDPYFVDVTEDERDTTAPDGIMHTGALVDAFGNSYTPAGFWRTAEDAAPEDETKKKAPETGATSAGQNSTSPGETSSTAGSDSLPPKRKDEQPTGGGVDMGMVNSFAGPVLDNLSNFAMPIAEGIGSAIGNVGSGLLASRRYADPGDNDNGYEVPMGELEHLRDLSDDDPDLGHTDSQNRGVRDAVEYLREHGLDASTIVASKDCCDGCCDGGDCESCDCHGSSRHASYGLGNQGMGQPGGAFLQPGGASWADRAFSGSGPDPKYWYDSSENLIDRGAEHIDEVDVTEGTGETNHWDESDRPAQGKNARRRVAGPYAEPQPIQPGQTFGPAGGGASSYDNYNEAYDTTPPLDPSGAEAGLMVAGSLIYASCGNCGCDTDDDCCPNCGEDMRGELLQSVGEEIEGIGQYEQFLDEAERQGDDEAADAIEEAIDDETDHVENFTDALQRESGRHDFNDVMTDFTDSQPGFWGTSASDGVRSVPQFEPRVGPHSGYAAEQNLMRKVPGQPSEGKHRAEAGVNDVVRRFQASGGGALANDGGGSVSDDAIAVQARKFLAKTAGRVYSLAEQQELVEESHPEGARNKPNKDDLRGTHYV